MSEGCRVEIDTGTAYGLKAPTFNPALVDVSPGMPMGELMRRYWQPCFTSVDLTSDRPRKVRLLGENLILFRDKEGRPGLVAENCCHRGTSLFYGRIEEDGIRCCYHGWKFDTKGNCVDRPSEVGRGLKVGRIRQPWYPVEERYGLVYAYMGPPEKKPVLPRWKIFENLGPDEVIETRWRPHYGPVSDAHDRYEMSPIPVKWLAAYENTMDGPHVPWLHYNHSGDQFSKLKLMEGQTEIPPYGETEDLVAKMVVAKTQLGVKQGFPMLTPDGREVLACNEAIIPNSAVIPGFIDMAYFVPVDNDHIVQFFLWRSKYHGERSNLAEYHWGKGWYELTDAERQLSPGDFEAQHSIGAVPFHSREHLSQGDAGIVMLRRRLEEAVRDVADGRDPVGVSFDHDGPAMEVEGHGFVPHTAEAL